MRGIVWIVVLGMLASSAGWAQSSAQRLGRMLAQKGVITNAELTQVEAAASGEDGVRMLTALLQQKGLLSGSEVAQLSAGPAPVAVAAAPVLTPVLAPAPLSPESPPVTSQQKFPVTITGTLLFSSFYNTALPNTIDLPLTLAKQGSDALGNDKSFGMTARQSRFGLRYDGGEVLGAKLSGQFEFDLFGGKAALPNGVDMDLFRLRLAFGRLDWNHFSVEAGQDWSVFAPLNPASFAQYAIPEAAGAGNLWIRTPQLRLEIHQKLNGETNLDWQFAATNADSGDYPDEFRTAHLPGAGERGRAPGGDLRLAVSGKLADRPAAVGLSTHYTRGKNAGMSGDVIRQVGVDSWGVALDYSVPLGKPLTLLGELYTGRALGIFSSSLGLSYLPVGTRGERGVLSGGGWAQAQWTVTPKTQFNLGYGFDGARAAELRVGDRFKNQAYFGSVFYKVSPAFTLAWEYRRMLSDYNRQKSANERGDHVNLGVAYTF